MPCLAGYIVQAVVNLLAVLVYAVGGELLEVLVSPIVEACPMDNKEKVMSLLERFMIYSGILCMVSYLLVSFMPIPIIELAGCGLCDYLWEFCGLEHLAWRRYLLGRRHSYVCASGFGRGFWLLCEQGVVGAVSGYFGDI